MASVYKRTRRKRIPDGAELVTYRGKPCATWQDGRGRKQRAPLSEDGRAIIVEAEHYTIELFNHEGRRKRIGTKIGDKDAARQLANKLETEADQRRRGYFDARQERLAEDARRPLADHLADFRAYLEDKQDTPKHVRMTCQHVEWLAESCGAEHVADLTGPAVLSAVGDLRDSGASLRTCNSYLTSAKAFSRWLWKHKRTSDDPLCALEKFNQETDPRHVRRELLPDEAARLVAAAERRELPKQCLRGTDRATVYRLAFGTGFRAKELRSLTPTSFHLDSDPPTVIAKAGHTKRKRTDCQPIRGDLAELLRPWLADRAADERLFAKLPGNTARMLRSDMAIARAEWTSEAPTEAERKTREQTDFLRYKNAVGEVADFHSTRHTYISSIVASGASVKTCQELARHSSPTLTIGRYSHVRLMDLKGALDGLPSPASATSAPEPQAVELRATGTEARLINQSGTEQSIRGWAQNGAQSDGKSGQNTASGGEKTSKPTDNVDKAQLTLLSVVGKEKPPLAGGGEKRRRPDSNRGWRICNPLP